MAWCYAIQAHPNAEVNLPAKIVHVQNLAHGILEYYHGRDPAAVLQLLDIIQKAVAEDGIAVGRAGIELRR